MALLIDDAHVQNHHMDAFRYINTTNPDWSSRSEKTLLMSTPKRPGDQIWQIYLGKSADVPPIKTARALSELYAL